MGVIASHIIMQVGVYLKKKGENSQNSTHAQHMSVELAGRFACRKLKAHTIAESFCVCPMSVRQRQLRLAPVLHTWNAVFFCHLLLIHIPWSFMWFYEFFIAHSACKMPSGKSGKWCVYANETHSYVFTFFNELLSAALLFASKCISDTRCDATSFIFGKC